MKAFERLLDYVKFDTQSDESSDTFPSTEKQKIFAEHLLKELNSLGINNAVLDENGYVYATIEASAGYEDKTGFAVIAHMDTAPDMSGKDVKAQVIEYNGGDIVLNKDKNIVTKASEFPELESMIGKHLIVTDGTTLLGADDKAGIAIIMTFAEMIMKDSSLPHPMIQIIFTPDEEIGRGVDKIDMTKIKVPYAYTLDGGDSRIFQYETFNASKAVVTIHGITAHPGYAKGKMRNACLMVKEFDDLLPKYEIPYTTEKREGFYHLTSIEATEEKATLTYILRDHDENILKNREEMIKKAAAFLSDKYGYNAVEVKIIEMYKNMAKEVEKHPSLINTALKAMKNVGLEPVIEPVRGGTDGSRLSFMGLPCPNLPTGCHNGHGRHEFVAVEDLDICTDLLIEIAASLLIKRRNL